MEPTPALIFGVGLLASFIGTLPFGPINLSVVDTTINRSFRAAVQLSLAAALVEIPQSLIALKFNPFVQHLLTGNVYVKIASVILFLGMGCFFLFRKPACETKQGDNPKKKNNFIQGFLIAIANPQAIPFWIFVLSFLKSSQHLDLSNHLGIQLLFVFVLGVASGKLLALLGYAKLGQLVIYRVAAINQLMNKIIGGILIGLGLLQGVHGFLNYYL
jgi:threonine/homoserine/homoserine lactone efflux protein